MRDRPPRWLLARTIPCLLIPVLVLGSANYIENVMHFGSLAGGAPSVLKRAYARASAPANVARVVWSVFLDAPGVPVPRVLQNVLDGARRALFAGVQGSYFGPPDQSIRTDVDEDTDALGVTGLLLLLLLPLIVWAVASGRAPPAERVLALAAVIYVLGFAIVLGYSPDDGRLLLPGLVLATPLLARLAMHRWGRAVAVAPAVAAAWPLLMANPSKRVLPPSSLALSQTAQQLNDFEDYGPVLKRLALYVGPHDPLGYVESRDFTDTDWPLYPLFGDGPARRIEMLTPADLTPRWMRNARVRAVFVPPSKCRGAGCTIDLRGVTHVPLGDGVELALNQR